MAIIDSGARRQFDSGAVRDIQEGKGRCDLLPLIEVSVLLENSTLRCIGSFMETGDTDHLHAALREFWKNSRCHFDCLETMILEYAKHMEEGAQKYQERNWEKGIPLHCFIDSGVRHLLKFYRGDSDERHDRAFVWNVLGAIWTVRNHPELCDLPAFEYSEVEMTNFEKYKETIETTQFGIIEGKPIQCNDVEDCADCDFNTKNCVVARMKWLKAEYEEPRINLPKALMLASRFLT